jgi:hypothetical protein
MNQKRVKCTLLALLLILLVTGVAAGFAGDDWTQEDVAAIEREYTYTTAEAVAAGKRAAERYWLTHYTIYEVAAAEREFTYTTAEAVEKGRIAAEAFWQSWESRLSH